MGTQFMRRRKSALIDGAGDDARDLSAHLMSYLDSPRRAPYRAAFVEENPGANRALMPRLTWHEPGVRIPTGAGAKSAHGCRLFGPNAQRE